MRQRRPSPALLLSLIALLVGLGGTVYAASKINGKTIKKASIPGNRLKKNTLTGKQIGESSLGTVPNANHASSSDQLQGKTAADFAPAGKVLTSGWVTASSCGNGCASRATLLNNGTFDLVGGCQGNTSGPGAFGFLRTDGASVPYFGGFSGFFEAANTPAQFFDGSGTENTGLNVNAVNFDLLASSGAPLSGSATVIANYPSAGHCAFNASAISG
jgi:hypothetical protein